MTATDRSRPTRRWLRTASAAVISTVLLATASAGVVRADTDVVVRPGEGWYAIADRAGVSVGSLLAANGARLDTVVHPGQRLVVPGEHDADEQAAAGTIVVRAGDGWLAVARRAGTTIERLLAANGLQLTSVIHPGQELVVPAGDAGSSTSPGSAGASSGGGSVTVRAGEGLLSVASRVGAPIDALLRENGLRLTSVIHPGQRLAVPPVGGESSDAPAPAAGADLPSGVGGRADLVPLFRRAAEEAGVPADLLMAVAYHESRWRPDAVSPSGALGVMQIMPRTAQWVASDMIGEADLDPRDPADNLRLGAHLLAWLIDRAGGDVDRALAGYLQGHVAVDRNGPSAAARRYAAAVAATRADFG